MMRTPHPDKRTAGYHSTPMPCTPYRPYEFRGDPPAMSPAEAQAKARAKARARNKAKRRAKRQAARNQDPQLT